MADIHDNSHTAYHGERAQGRLSKRQAVILRWMEAQGPHAFTDREIAARLDFPDMNCVRPRLTELIDMGLIEEAGNVRCPVTGKRVRTTRVAVAGQLEFGI